MSRLIAPFAQFFDGAGDPLVNGWLKFLYAGTNNTLKDTYADEGLTIANENPLQLDGEGRCASVFGQGTYKIILYANNPITQQPGAQIAAFDPVRGQYTAVGTQGQFADWDATTEYEVGDIVIYNGLYYRSLQASNLNYAPDANLDWWEEISFLNPWNIYVTYNLNDIVKYGPNLYSSLQASNLGNQPDISPTYWGAFGSGTTLLQWEENGTTFRPKASGGDIGDATHLVGDIYQQSTASHFFDSSQVIKLVSDGTDLDISIGNGTGDLNIKTGATPSIKWLISNAGNLLPGADNSYDIGATTALPRNIFIGTTGRMYFFSTGPAVQASIQHTGTNWNIINEIGDMIFWASNAAGDILFQTREPAATKWTIQSAGHFVPGTANSYDIGSTTAELRDVYIGNSGVLYFGSSQQSGILHNGTYLFINNTVGNLTIRNEGDIFLDAQDAGGQIRFRTGATPTEQWEIAANGNLLPVSTNDIGGTAAQVRAIYLGDGSSYGLWVGNSQDLQLYHDNATGNSYLRGYTNNLYVGSTTGFVMIQTGASPTGRWKWDTNGHYLPNAANTYDLGGTANEVRNMYIGGSAYFGTAQEGEIWHNASHLYLNAQVGAMRFQIAGTERWLINTAGHFTPSAADTYDIGSATNEILNIYVGDAGRIYVGLDQDLSIYSNGTHGYISATTGSAIYFGANATTYWVMWTDGSLQPNVTNTNNIGSTTKCLNNVYMGDNSLLYFGDGQDARIVFDGTNLEINTTVGGRINLESFEHLSLRAGGTSDIIFRTTNSETIRWRIKTSGDLVPEANNAYNIGTTSLGLNNVYLGDNSFLYFGDSQDASIYHATSLYIVNNTGSTYIGGNAAAGLLYLLAGAAQRWIINASGHLYPAANNSYDLGTTANSVRNVYTYSAYFGASSEGVITHDGSDFKISNTDATGCICFYAGGATPGRICYVQYDATYPGFYPDSNGSEYLGFFGIAWKEIWVGGVFCSSLTGTGVYANAVTGRDVIVKSDGEFGTISSAARFKVDAKDIGDTSWIHDLKPRTYVRADGGMREVGFIAEEVEKVNPHYVWYNGNEIHGVDYRQLNVALLAEVQQLRKELNALKEAA